MTLLQIDSPSHGPWGEGIEALVQKSYPKVVLLKQIKGVGTLIALTFRLTLEDPHRFDKSRAILDCSRDTGSRERASRRCIIPPCAVKNRQGVVNESQWLLLMDCAASETRGSQPEETAPGHRPTDARFAQDSR